MSFSVPVICSTFAVWSKFALQTKNIKPSDFTFGYFILAKGVFLIVSLFHFVAFTSSCHSSDLSIKIGLSSTLMEDSTGLYLCAMYLELVLAAAFSWRLTGLFIYAMKLD